MAGQMMRDLQVTIAANYNLYAQSYIPVVRVPTKCAYNTPFPGMPQQVITNLKISIFIPVLFTLPNGSTMSIGSQRDTAKFKFLGSTGLL